MNITKQNRINFESGMKYINERVNIETINEEEEIKEEDAVTIEEIFDTFRWTPVLDQMVKQIQETRKRGFNLY